MPEYICNTSPLQYLHQLGQISILPALTAGIIVPAPVIAELEAGRALGCDVPDVRGLPWVTTLSHRTRRAVAPSQRVGEGRGEGQICRQTKSAGSRAQAMLTHLLASPVARNDFFQRPGWRVFETWA